MVSVRCQVMVGRLLCFICLFVAHFAVADHTFAGKSVQEDSLEALSLKSRLDLSFICSRWLMGQVKNRNDAHSKIWQQLLTDEWDKFSNIIQTSLPGASLDAFLVAILPQLQQIDVYLKFYLNDEISFQTNQQRRVEQFFKTLKPHLEDLVF